MLLQMALSHSFLWLSDIPVCVCMCVYLHVYTHISHFLFHPSVGGPLGCFHILTIVNNAAMNTEVHLSIKLVFLFSLDIYPGVEFL